MVGAIRLMLSSLKMTIRTIPEVPAENSMLWKILTLNGVFPAGYYCWHHCDVIMVHEDFTFHSVNWVDYIGTHHRLPSLPLIINGRCNDISKSYIDKVFGDVFSYRVTVDPLTHVGPMVKKGNANATHDGCIIQGPIASDIVDPSCVYNILISNQDRADPTLIIDYRVPVVLGSIPIVYKKFRKIGLRFKSKNERVEVIYPESVFSPEDIGKILRFCRVIGLDLGEIDVLFCETEKRFYIIDANNTPGGPPNSLGFRDYFCALFKIAALFRKNLKNQCPDL